YDPENLSAGWYFTSTVTDTLSGLALANASWDHANDVYDQLTYDPGLGGDGVFNGVSDDGDGVVTVTLTITDNVGNLANDTVVFNLDDTGPTIISPTLDEDSNFLHADGFTLYYGDDMATPVVFWVEGEAQDDGAGPYQAIYSDAFESPPTDDDLAPPSYSWEGYYVVAPEEDYGPGTITVTVSDQVGNSATQVFNYVRDTSSPTIVPTSINEGGSPSLHAEGLTVYYSDMMGGSAQDFEIQGTASDEGGAGFQWVTFPPAFGDSVDPDSNSPWSGVYNVVSSNNGDGNILVTAFDNVGNWSTGVFTYIEDTTIPTVTLTYVTPPGYDEDDPDDYLDADGSNWYNAGDFTAGGDWEFHYDTADDGAGLASGSAFWDHSNDLDDQQIPALDLDGDDVFNDVDDDEEGVVTVTLTITDNVSNPASASVVFNIDNTEPVITSPYLLDYDSQYLHVDDLTVYYGDDMGSAQTFTVHGHSSDGDGVGLNVTDTVEFSSALGDNPSNLGTPEDWWGEYNAASYNTDSGTIIVTAYDLLNNPATQVFTYTRDTGDPSSGASSPQYDNGNPIVVNYSNATDTGGSGLQWVRLWYKKEVTGTWANSGLSPQTGPSGSFNFTPTEGDGTYYFATRAEDNVGNQEAEPAGSGDDETLYDTMQPSVPGNFAYQLDSDSGGDGFPPEAGYYDDRTIDLEWDPSTDNGSGLLTYHLGTAPQPTGGTYAEDSPYDVGSSGTHNIYLAAEDNAGNISDDAVTGPVVVDDQPPQGSVDCPEGTAAKSFTVNWLATDQGLAGLRSTDPYSVRYNVDGGGWQDWITATSAVTATFGPDSPVPVDYDHTYCFRVRAVDRAGNVSEWAEDCTEVSEAYSHGTKVFLPLIMTPDPNWGFELGNFTNWQHGGQLAQSVSTAMPHSGIYSALLGNPGYDCYNVPVGSAWLRRSVTVPSGGSPTLSFWYRIYTQDRNSILSDEYDLFAVYINGSDLVVKDANLTYPFGCSTTHNLVWKYVSFPLDAYEGQTIQITFYNYNRAPAGQGPEWYNTYTYVDDVSVQ
ncbi:MAG: hypothetical protein OEW09_05440, partial [Anaerolineae bacterium]|nr:hypothetical protein [Anaerolineae bacterium]